MPARLLLDEDVRLLLAEVLRERGIDAIHVQEVGRGGKFDTEQLAYAAAEKRSFLTHNVRDFVVLRAHGQAMTKSAPIVQEVRRIRESPPKCDDRWDPLSRRFAALRS